MLLYQNQWEPWGTLHISLTLTTPRTSLSWVSPKDSQHVNPKYLPHILSFRMDGRQQGSSATLQCLQLQTSGGKDWKITLKAPSANNCKFLCFRFEIQHSFELSFKNKMFKLHSFRKMSIFFSSSICKQFQIFPADFPAPDHPQCHPLFTYNPLIGDALNSN